jgi:hypothetical protein
VSFVVDGQFQVVVCNVACVWHLKAGENEKGWKAGTWNPCSGSMAGHVGSPSYN